MYKTQFAVTQTTGNEETILQYFDQKEEACSFGQAKTKTIDRGVIAVIRADFDEAGKMRDNTCSVFDIYGAE